MSQIDLKNATIKIKDGYQKLGAVNNVAGYPIGTSTMTVDGFTGAVVTGDLFTLAADTQQYKITAHTETTSNTTSVTFTPALLIAATDNEVITVGPHELSIKVGEGTMSYTEKRNVVYTLDRGKLSEVKLGDESPVEVRLDFIWEFLKASTGQPPTVEDTLKKRGGATTWVSSSTDLCQPYAVDIEIEYKPPCGNEEKEVITLNDFRYEDLAHDAKQGSVSVTGKCNITEASVVRLAA